MESFDEVWERINAINSEGIKTIKEISELITPVHRGFGNEDSPITGQLLALTRGFREVSSLVTTLYEKAILDSVGLYSKTYLDERRDKLCEEQNLAFLICDVDKFKSYNDTYGHLQGDIALSAIAQQFSKSIKQNLQEEENAFIARYGGEEFCAFIENCSRNRNEIYCLADIVRQEIESLKITCLEGYNPPNIDYEKRTITIACGLRKEKEPIKLL